MLLEQAFAEFSQIGNELQIGNEGNEEPEWENVEKPHTATEKPHTEAPNSIPEKKVGRVECNGNAYLMSPELKLHLESERQFFHRLLIRNESANRNSEDSLAGCRAPVSVPFKWEEEPGKPKNLSVEEAPLVLSLPPVRQSALNSQVGDARSIANSPRTLSGRLRNSLLAKFHVGKPFDPAFERRGERQVVANELLQYPGEFGCGFQKDSSPVSIFECPDSPSSSSSSLLSYCSRPSSSTRQDSASALLANRLVPMKEMLSAVPVESPRLVCPRLPAPFASVIGDKHLGPKMTGSSCEEAMGSRRIRREFNGVQSVRYGSSPDALIRAPLTGKRSARNSSRSVSWGSTEIIDAKMLREPFNVLIPVEEEEVKGKACSKIKDHELHVASPSVSSTSIPVEQTSESSTPLCFGTSGSMKMIYCGPRPGSDKWHNTFQGTARSDKHSKLSKDGLSDDCNMEVEGQKKTMGSCRHRSQVIKARSKRWTFGMQSLRMNITNCCSPAASNTVNCYSSRRATHGIGGSQDRKKSTSVSNHQKLQLEWRKLYEDDYIQRISLF